MSVFLKPEDSLLRIRVPEVPTDSILSNEIQSYIETMFQIAKGERTDTEKSVMVGLAAPQVGIPLRIILVDIGVDADRKNLGNLVVYINPKIIWYSDEEVIGREGCFSVDSRLSGIVSRPQHIRFTAFDRQGHSIEDELFGFSARIFQHEMDHLNGCCFPDRVGENGMLHWVVEEDYPEYRINWQNWPYRCPWNTWIDIREGRPYLDPVILNIPACSH